MDISVYLLDLWRGITFQDVPGGITFYAVFTTTYLVGTFLRRRKDSNF